MTVHVLIGGGLSDRRPEASGGVPLYKSPGPPERIDRMGAKAMKPVALVSARMTVIRQKSAEGIVAKRPSSLRRQGEGLNINRGAALLASEAILAEGGQSGSVPLREPIVIESLLRPDNLHQAGKRVRRNKGRAGVDGITREDYPGWARAHGSDTRRGLERGYYCPMTF